MPPEAASAREAQGPRAGWTQSVELQASLLDALKLHSFYWLSANGATPDEPEPFPRPGVTREVAAMSLTDFNSFLKG